MYKHFFKRLLDILVSAIALVILSPMLLILYVLVKVRIGSPVFFTQDRVGKKEHIFKMYKFRSMTNETDREGNLLTDDKRLTNFGKTLRATSLDELPELWNILKGDMSIVGPRPLLVSYLPLYSEFQKRRHEVSPGLTGLAQVNGRNMTTWQNRFNLDVKYVKQVNFVTDIKIIFKTLKKVLHREGVSSEKSVTMEPFKGNDVDE
ncbi:sugar transferase [Aerococcus urinaeequi]|uniref:Sugar transferase n=1 Tax=Aerococcus urinaeequi TaxID=51665 RepID=A0A7M1KS12_9LACT|nr:sugar transferase [Aerococcus urinaeequi]QOQ78668.1 sugar transferase [Aerococcus urinaeequi]